MMAGIYFVVLEIVRTRREYVSLEIFKSLLEEIDEQIMLIKLFYCREVFVATLVSMTTLPVIG
jgi:hypothetical protein